MRRHIVASVRMFIVVSISTGMLYPLAITAIAHVAFRRQASGSLVSDGDRVVGSSLLGQPFTGAAWFHSRPGTGAAAVSGPSNLGPSNPALAADVRRRAASMSPGAAVLPVDALTGSGSGLDADISVANATLQAQRVARARGLSIAAVLALIERETVPRTFGFLGEPRVNVLSINLALDELASAP